MKPDGTYRVIHSQAKACQIGEIEKNEIKTLSEAEKFYKDIQENGLNGRDFEELKKQAKEIQRNILFLAEDGKSRSTCERASYIFDQALAMGMIVGA